MYLVDALRDALGLREWLTDRAYTGYTLRGKHTSSFVKLIEIADITQSTIGSNLSEFIILLLSVFVKQEPLFNFIAN